jgi:CDP-glucose 4,6-dehydratase
MTIDHGFWRNQRVLLTGHTGFKGSWLSLWLQRLGADVHGFALEPPTSPSLFVEARVAQRMHSIIGDVRDAAAVARVLTEVSPDIVIHMAAQPLVRQSYADPVETYGTNVMGTVHLLEAIRQNPSVRAVVCVTTDKCYENKEWVWGYREDEPMGGHDPYSNSKGCAELVTSAYRRSFLAAAGTGVSSARAGNVVGGGDWAVDRLVPDLLRAFESGEAVVVRNPSAIRPWQHVLEPLSGYLTLAQSLVREGQTNAEAFNFGPDDGDTRPVQWVVEHLAERWGDRARWLPDGRAQPHEANHLKLDISKAHARLGWRPRWRLAQALDRVIQWHQAWLANDDAHALCLRQIAEYSEACETSPA